MAFLVRDLHQFSGFLRILGNHVITLSRITAQVVHLRLHDLQIRQLTRLAVVSRLISPISNIFMGEYQFEHSIRNSLQVILSIVIDERLTWVGVFFTLDQRQDTYSVNLARRKRSLRDLGERRKKVDIRS